MGPAGHVRGLVAASLCLASPGPAAASTDAADLEAIDRHVESEMRAVRVSGLALAIVHGDRIVRLRGFGVTRRGGAAVTPETPFPLGSVSKSFAALAVMQQVEAGRLQLDTPVVRYLPWFRTADAEASRRITLRHLLSHTSGVGEREGWRDVEGGELEPRVRALAGVSLRGAPGERFEYSNANYSVLVLVLEAATGERFGDYVKRRVLVPLAMRRSFVSRGDARPHGLASGHRYWFGWPEALEPPLERSPSPPAGLVSCAADMARYLLAQMNDGRLGGVTVLSAAGTAEMHTPQPGAAYGLGWFVTDWRGPRQVWHGGGTPGFTAMVAYRPSDRWGVVTLMNGFSFFGNVRRYEIAGGVLKLLAGGRPDHVAPDRTLAALYTASLALLLFVCGGAARTLGRLSRDRRTRNATAAGPSPARPAIAVLRAVPPLLLVVAAGACGLLSLRWLLHGGSLRLAFLVQPDLTLLLVLVGAVAFVWGVLGAFRRTARMAQTPPPQATSPPRRSPTAAAG